MADEIVVGPSESIPTHHVKLSRGSDEIGLVLCDEKGNFHKHMPRIRRDNRASILKYYEGDQGYADQKPHVRNVVINDLSKGRGNYHYEEGASGFWDSWRADTRRKERVVLGPQEKYTSGIRDFDESWPGSVIFKEIYYGAAITWRTTKFTSSAAYNMMGIGLILKRVGSPQDITVSLYSDNAGNLNAELKSKTVSASDVTSDVLSIQYLFEFDSVYACANATDYHVVVKADSSDNADNHWEVACDTDNPTGGQIYRGAFVADYALYYRVLDDTDEFDILPFIYRKGMYIITQPKNYSTSKMYLLGYRGVADDNSGDKSKLVDAAAAWTVNEWSGDNAIVMIVAGPGSDESKPWRAISSNDGTSLTVDEDWEKTHTNETEYVIIAETIWNEVSNSGIDHYVTDVAVGDRYVYIAEGTEDYIHRYQAYRDTSGDFAERDADESVEGTKLGIYIDETGIKEWRTYKLLVTRRHEHDIASKRGAGVLIYTIPPMWGALYVSLGELAPTNKTWDQYVDTGNNISKLSIGMVNVQVGAGFGTGALAGLVISAADISDAEGMAFAIYASNNDWAAGEVTLSLGDGVAAKDYDLGAINAGEWSWQQIDLETKGENSTADMTAITQICLKVTADKGTESFYLWDGGILLEYQGNNVHYLTFFSQVNKILEYAAGDQNYQKLPWIFTEEIPFYIEGETLKPLYMPEVKSYQCYRNGEGAAVIERAVYFNVGKDIIKYYNGEIEFVGPAGQGYGLPEERRGVPCSLTSYGGNLLAAIDAEDNRSSIMERSGGGWHEIYRAPWGGKRIKTIFVQAMEGAPDRLLFSEGADVGWLPLAKNPEVEEGYRYTNESVVEAGRVHAKVQDVEKFMKAQRLASENLSSGHQEIICDYKLDSASSWVELGAFNTSPHQERDFSATHDKSGKWIELRFRMRSDDNGETPVWIAAVLEMMYRFDIKPEYELQFRLAEGDVNFNLQRDLDDIDGVDKLSQLDSWIEDPKPILLNTNSAYENGIWVFPEPSPVEIEMCNYEAGEEVRVGKIKVIEI